MSLISQKDRQMVTIEALEFYLFKYRAIDITVTKTAIYS
jgi:hypothetical protein